MTVGIRHVHIDRTNVADSSEEFLESASISHVSAMSLSFCMLLCRYSSFMVGSEGRRLACGRS